MQRLYDFSIHIKQSYRFLQPSYLSYVMHCNIGQILMLYIQWSNNATKTIWLMGLINYSAIQNFCIITELPCAEQTAD